MEYTWSTESCVTGDAVCDYVRGALRYALRSTTCHICAVDRVQCIDNFPSSMETYALASHQRLKKFIRPAINYGMGTINFAVPTPQ